MEVDSGLGDSCNTGIGEVDVRGEEDGIFGCGNDCALLDTLVGSALDSFGAGTLRRRLEVDTIKSANCGSICGDTGTILLRSSFCTQPPALPCSLCVGLI